MRRTIGVVREAYSKWERRAPLTPEHVATLISRHNIEVLVQPSSKRVFLDREYLAAGATITEDLSSASAILGVKQVPVDALLPGKTYVMFSHTVKAQPENMRLLDACLERRIRLIDYECVRREGKTSAPRLIAFGEFAGKSGLINGLRGVGERLLSLGHSTPFLSIGATYSYPDYKAACDALARVGERVQAYGLPAEHAPFVVGIVGTGNVSRGVQHALRQLGGCLEMVAPHELPALSRLAGTTGEHQHKVYGCVVPLEYQVQPLGASSHVAVDREEYYACPEKYRPIFHEEIAPHLSLLATAMYWDRRFPKLLTAAQLAHLRAAGHARLVGVADITCDVDGAVEMLVRSSSVEEPFYMYDVERRQECARGSEGDGVLVMGVDILPAELPREASEHFGEALLPFVDGLVSSDPTEPFERQAMSAGGKLPAELWAATITANGQLTPSFQFIPAMRRANERQSCQSKHAPTSDPLLLQGSTVVAIKGHLFDFGVINAVLDVVEAASAHFAIIETSVTPLMPSTVLLQLTVEQGRGALDEVLSDVRDVVAANPDARASIQELPDFCEGVYDRTLSRASKRPASHARRHVVVMGAGMCAKPAVEFLSRDRSTMVTVVSSLDGEAAALCKSLRRPNLAAVSKSAAPADRDDWAAVCDLIASADGVLSLLPAGMHPAIATACVRGRTPLVTASYISEAALHEKAEAAGVPLLCEMGLDPGMDHMSALRIIADAQARGGTVTSFSSVCGGLPAPECADNPLMYKFSWSPAGVMAAAENSATYRRAGEVVRVAANELLRSAEPLRQGRLARVLNLEVLPNRDSLPYGVLYGIDDTAADVFRGTLRYAGWSSLMADFKELGLTDATSPLPQGAEDWKQLSAALRIESRSSAAALECLRWLGAFDEARPLVGSSPRAAFSALLQERLAYGPAERDAVFMEHTLEVSFPTASDRRKERISSSLVVYGTPGETAMSKTVGLTAAIGLTCLMRGDGTLRGGVFTPTHPAVYQYCLDALNNEGLSFVEHTSSL